MKSMKKWLALAVALVMVMACGLASAATVSAQVYIDGNAVKAYAAQMNGEEAAAAQQPLVDMLLGLINAAKLDAVITEEGGELRLSLNGKDAATLAAGAVEGNTVIVSSLFPNTVITVKPETVQQLAMEALQQIPGFTAIMSLAQSSEDLTAALPESVTGYVAEFMQTLTTAVQMGEAEKGTFTIEGIDFDTKTPVTVNTAAIFEAAGKLLTSIMTDEGMQAIIAQIAGAAGMEIPPVEDLQAQIAGAASQIPATMEANVFSIEGEERPMVIQGEAANEGEEAAVAYTVVLYNDSTAHIALEAKQQNAKVEITVAQTGGAFRVEKDGAFVHLTFGLTLGEPSTLGCTLYVNSEENPAVSATLIISQEGGELTMSLDSADKQVVAVEDLRGENAQEALLALQQDLMGNGLPGILSAAEEAAPGISQILNLLMGGVSTTVPAGEPVPAGE